MSGFDVSSQTVRDSNSRLIALALALKAWAFRLRVSRSYPARLASIPAAAFYRALSLYVIGFDIPTSVVVGEGLVIHHGIGLVVNDRAVIGRNVTLRHNTTIGAVSVQEAAPQLGDNVDVGANVVVLGPVVIGPGAVLGAGSVVVRDVPAGATVVGNPAKEIRPISTEDAN
ncbi:serine O-acetyltransferase [Paenarthrobacter nitroguajacolicus]|uniref:serine O-acetyltransferase n=1 Tax=Paenarthrobacter nitroguajacolicus TaxID=211146 RepID=UPI00248AF2E4|nr:hypothetical protein [Paenarthrobacter nitroguajacolicus]